MEPTGRRKAPPVDRLRDIRLNDDIPVLDDEAEQLAVACRINAAPVHFLRRCIHRVAQRAVSA